MIFDKTGTLTSERPLLLDPALIDSLPDDAALALARLTRASLHPVSRTLLEQLGSRGQSLLDMHGTVPVAEHPGLGVTCTSEDAQWFLGRAEEGVTVLRRNEETLACFRFQDALRPAAAGALASLVKRGLTLHILSGDAPEKVAHVTAALGIPASHAEGGLDPVQKASRVAALDHRNTLYLGDGANDSLAFDAAYVTGTPVVDRSLLEAKADFYSLGGGLNHLPEAFAAADARARGIHAAFTFALVYNIVVISLAAMSRMNPLLAAIVMPLSSVVAILLVVTAGRKAILVSNTSNHPHPDEHDQTNPGPGAIQRVPA
ncbi:MAG: HAD family hydrolase [Luteolibacter sp.]